MRPRQTLTAFRLPADILDAMRYVRERDGIGLSEQVRRALRDALVKRGALAAPPRRRQRKK